MKANAPEKIYIEIRHPFGNEFTEMLGFEHRGKSDDIEYTRTDAFIEKACVWLHTMMQTHAVVELLNGEHYEKELINDFRKAMED